MLRDRPSWAAMAVEVSPPRNPRLISSRSASVNRPGPGDHAKGLAVRVGGFITTFHAVCKEASICSAISVKLSPFVRSRCTSARCSAVRCGFPTCNLLG